MYYLHAPCFFRHQPGSGVSSEQVLAETWAHFIFEAKPADHSISQEKILFFSIIPTCCNSAAR